jgi:hypothetical protein
MSLRRTIATVLVVVANLLFPALLRAQEECNGGIAALVEPDGTVDTSDAFTTGNAVVFTVRNNGPCTDYTDVAAAGTGTVSGVTIEGPSSIWMGPWSQVNVTVRYDIGAPPGGSVHLAATGYIQDEGFYFTVIAPYTVAVTPDNRPDSVIAGTTRADTFHVRNTSSGPDTYALTCSAPAGNLTCGTVLPDSVTLAPGADTVVIVGFTAGATGATATLRLTATAPSRVYTCYDLRLPECRLSTT